MKEAIDGGSSSTVLAMVRSNAAFHYYQPKMLAEAYRAFFFTDPTSANNEAAYVSVGNDMDATRFYYADAAAQRCMQLAGEKQGESNVTKLLDQYMDRDQLRLVPSGEGVHRRASTHLLKMSLSPCETL